MARSLILLRRGRCGRSGVEWPRPQPPRSSRRSGPELAPEQLIFQRSAGVQALELVEGAPARSARRRTARASRRFLLDRLLRALISASTGPSDSRVLSSSSSDLTGRSISRSRRRSMSATSSRSSASRLGRSSWRLSSSTQVTVRSEVDDLLQLLGLSSREPRCHEQVASSCASRAGTRCGHRGRSSMWPMRSRRTWSG